MAWWEILIAGSASAIFITAGIYLLSLLGRLLATPKSRKEFWACEGSIFEIKSKPLRYLYRVGACTLMTVSSLTGLGVTACGIAWVLMLTGVISV